MKRYVSVAFRRLLTDWYKRKTPSLKEQLFVVAVSDHGRMLITEVSPEIAKQGISVGMTMADARALLPDINMVEEEKGLAERLLEGLAGWCIRFSPEVAVDLPDGLIIDASGCAHLFGGEEAYLEHIVSRFQALGYDVNLGMADTIGVAWAVSRFKKGNTVIPVGRGIQALEVLPPASLRLEAGILDRLRKLGLYRVGDFMAMPRSSLQRRFGSAMLERLDQALGIKEELFNPVRQSVPYQERVYCLEPVRTAYAISSALVELIGKLCKRLEKEGMGLRSAVFTGYRVDGKTVSVSVSTTRPSRSEKHLLKLFDPKLSSLEPGLGIEVFSLEAPNVEMQTVVSGKLWEIFGKADDSGLAELVDRIEGRIGKESVLRYLPAEHHLPERSVKTASAYEEKPASAWRKDRFRPLYLLTKPEKIEVTAPIPDYPPMNFRHRNVLHKVVKADGPERIEQQWWLRDGLHRDYYYVEDELGRRYWLFRLGHYSEQKKPTWYLHGYFP